MLAAATSPATSFVEALYFNGRTGTRAGDCLLPSCRSLSRWTWIGYPCFSCRLSPRPCSPFDHAIRRAMGNASFDVIPVITSSASIRSTGPRPM